MGLFNGLLRGVAGAGMVALVAKLVNDHGGLEGMANTLKQKGLADAVHSWIGTGENHRVTPEQMRNAFGGEELERLGRDSGMSGDEVASQLSNTLPQVMDRFSPQGQLPSENPFAEGEASVQDLIAEDKPNRTV